MGTLLPFRLLGKMKTRLQIALAASVAPFAPEAKYTLRTLATLAGFSHEFVWASPAEQPDIYYGPDPAHSGATVRIASTGDFSSVDRGCEPRCFVEADGLGFLRFDDAGTVLVRETEGALIFANDIVRSCYWLLTGAMDASYPRDSRDNLQIQNSFLVRHGILQRPLVSEYAQFFREFFTTIGKVPQPLPWMEGGKSSVFAFTHDVDYPQMIKGIECLRLLRDRGARAFPSIRGVLSGTNHFWQFSNWIELARKYGSRPTFYFSPVQGSLMQYAAGVPEVFYDVGSPAFRDLFKFLRDEGCEIGLHTSYRSSESSGAIAAERRRLQEVSGAQVEGNRHHYWRLNASAPEETLARHEAAGFAYDSSLGFELYPGWRRGVCHPFHAFHPTERRELRLLQIPPAWMDDHFHRRLAINKIASPDEHARSLLAAAAKTHGVVVVDYHARGMNADFFPRYGPWLARFLELNLGGGFQSLLPANIAETFTAYEDRLREASLDRTADASTAAWSRPDGGGVEICALQSADIPAVAELHFTLFGEPQQGGHSVAMLGRQFLEKVFYGLNLSNESFFCDVAKNGGRVIGFSVYSSHRDRVFRRLVRQQFLQTSWECAKILAWRPALLGNFFSNIRYLGGEPLPAAIRGTGWWIVAGVYPEFRETQWEQQHGGNVASRLFDRMEQTLRERKCPGWYGVVRPGNTAINKFLLRRGAREVGSATAQGLSMLYYYKSFEPGE